MKQNDQKLNKQVSKEYQLILLNVFAFLTHLIDEIRNHGDLPSTTVYVITIVSVGLFPFLPKPIKGLAAISSALGYTYGMIRYHFLPFFQYGDTTSIVTAVFVQGVSIAVFILGIRLIKDSFKKR